jgi:uncharacterized protein
MPGLSTQTPSRSTVLPQFIRSNGRMKRTIAFADRAVPVALISINVVSFVLATALLVAVGSAHAETPACSGSDMMAELAANDPGALAKIEDEAATTPNGKGLLWKIETSGSPPSYLFGTMHMTDPRVTSLPNDARRAFDKSATVVIETTEVLDQSAMMAELARNPDLMMFTDGTTLPSLLSSEQRKELEQGLAERGIMLASVSKMKPWMLSAIVSLPACELARKAAGAPILDIKLGEDARSSGKKIEGLETVADQLNAMASLPMDFHLKGLIDTLKLGRRIDDVIETMIVLYVKGDTGTFWPLFRAVLPNDEADQAGYAAFEQAMIVERNKTMARNAEPILAAGNAFIAVGALHLPGSDGLIELLRKHGHTVSAVR